MTNLLEEIRDFEARTRKALDEFFEDYKSAALINRNDHPLVMRSVDWADLFFDKMIELLAIPVYPIMLVEVEKDANVFTHEPQE